MRIPPKQLLRWSPLLFFGLAIAIFLTLFLRFQRKPEISGLDRLMAGPGDRLEISGRFFGDGMDGSKLYIGAQALTSTGILEWEENRILVRVPRSNGAALVKVKTRSGTSDGVILGDAERFPVVNYGPWLPGAPYIEYADPPSALPGRAVTLVGSGFGNRKGGGSIWVNRSDTESFFGTEEPDLSRYIEVDSIGSWSDSSVNFWMPPGATGGNVYLRKGGFFSNPVSVEAQDSPGRIIEGAPLQWSLRQEVLIDRIGAYPGNSLYLHIPSPSRGPGQDTATVLEGLSGDSYTAMRVDADIALYRLDELRSGERRGVSRQLIVTTRPIIAEIRLEQLYPYDPTNPELEKYLIRDKWIHPDSVAQVAAREVRGIQDDWSKSRALYDYLLRSLEWTSEPPADSIPDILSTGTSNSRGYSFLYSSLARAAAIPSRPVGGIIVLEDGTSHLWWWVENWIEGLGWIPIDPALGDLADDIRLSGASDAGEAAEYYFGGLEGRHIAFSRGLIDSAPLQPAPVLRNPELPYTLQGSWEEVSGNLESYASSWPVPRVTAIYGLD